LINSQYNKIEWQCTNSWDQSLIALSLVLGRLYKLHEVGHNCRDAGSIHCQRKYWEEKMWKRITSILALGILGAAAIPAAAADRPCRGTIGAVTVEGGQVPPGATCTLDGTSVKGNVTVQRGAALFADGVIS
jgi:hypothetical protein